MAARNPKSTIYAFEPTPKTFEHLKQNTSYYPNIKVFNCALGEKTGKSSIITVDDWGAQNYLGEGGTPIEVKTIDSLNLPVGFIKMDVEGFEGAILKGASETIRKNKPVIAMSAYHHPNDENELPKIIHSIEPSYICELHEEYEKDLICYSNSTSNR